MTEPDILTEPSDGLVVTRILLLVEDNPGDADLVREYLADAGHLGYEVLHVPRLDAALERLDEEAVDVILLDLRLPDASGTSSVHMVRDVSDVPIVVLTGTEDEELGLSCIDAGADDYLPKTEIEARTLQRAIGFAITRRREAQIRELEQTLAHYRRLSDRPTSITASSAGVGPLRERMPDDFTQLARSYATVLEDYLDQLVLRRERPRDEMERLVTRLGDANAGPRDLLNLHVEALEITSKGKNTARGRSLAVEGRLLALEMMGLLVDYYRTGTRRFDSFKGSP